MLNSYCRFLILVIIAIFAPFSNADIVTLKDGTVIEGVVIKESRAEVVIEITVSNIKTTKTFPRYKVKSIEHKPVEEEGSKEDIDTKDTEISTPSTSNNLPDSKTNRTRQRRATQAPRTLYMVVPVEGLIGEETNADGLRKALTQASRRKIEHVVFTIDSGGGYVYDAVETLKVLKEFDDQLNYHALVEEGAISAASVYVAGADNIFVRPDARVGGAVAYSSDNTSGAAEVDAKFNSIWAAGIAARAQSKGFPPEVFRAMVVLEAELWLDDENTVFASRPSGSAQQIDSKGTILTILAGQMIQIGMAAKFEGELSELGEELGLENWSEAKDMGQRIMETSAKERVKLSAKFTNAIEAFGDAFEDFENNNPSDFSDYRFLRGMDNRRAPDGNSVQLWRERCSTSIRACDIMLEALGHIADVNKRAAKIGALHLDIIPSNIGHDAYTDISEARSWLHANRNMIPLSMYDG
jgi:ATP-dependent protease ClpP protease subunit